MNRNEEYDKTRRKWVSQMTATEVTVLTETIQKYNKWKLSEHALIEMSNDAIQPVDVARVLKQGMVLEANNICAYDICVMLRKNVGERSIAVVVSLITGKVKTVYANELNADRRVPNLNNYVWTQSLKKINGIGQHNSQILA